ncbi:MAG: carboxypeptidase-like regulatory domain-containing protein [Prolixibacteraceae bacterium]
MKKHFLFAILFILSQIIQAREIKLIQIDSTYNHLSFVEFAVQLEHSQSIKVFYQNEWIEKIQTPQLDQAILLDDFLTRMLTPHDLHFINFQDNIIIMPGRQLITATQARQSNVVIIGDPMNKGKFKKAIISGTILDGKTKSPIPGAQVLCQELSLVTTSDFDGHFKIELPVGNHQLKFSFLGLTDELRDIELYNKGQMDIELYEKSINLNQINVTAERPEDNFRSTSMGMVKLNMQSIKKLSVLMGEPDVIKSMTMLPGVQSTGENASGFNVRGGNIDENLILIHQTPVYNTSHLFGLFSMLDGNLVKDVTLYKSGMPARFGGRIASVLDIELKKGQSEKMKVNGGIGIVNSRLNLAGPIGKKITFMAGARSTYSDWMLNLLKTYELKQSSAYFYDFNAKIDYAINKKNRLSVFGYGSTDYFNYFENAEYGYGNLLGSAQWSHIFNNNNSGNLNFNTSRYKASIVDFSSQNVEYRLNTSIEQEQLSYHFSTQTFSRHKVNVGFNAIRYLIEPGNSTPYNDQSIALPIQLMSENAFELSAYAEDEFDITPELAVIAGARFSNFLLMGPDDINRYPANVPLNSETIIATDVYSTSGLMNYFNGLEPRIAFRYEIEGASSIKLGYNRTKQYIRQISNSASITPADYWKTSDSYLKPLIADQVALGFFKNFDNNTFETSIEVYYKDIQNEVDYKNGAQLILNKDLEQVLIPGIGKAYGAEILIKKSKGALTGWLAYTYSRSFKKIDGTFAEEKINNGNWYNSNYDKPHDLSLAINYQLSRRFTFSSNFVYNTGRPVTFPEQKYMISTYEVVTFSDRNKYRLPDYHRLDLSITYEGSLLVKQKWRSSWTFSIYNVYGRNNAFSVYYDRQKPSNQNDYRTYSLYKFSIIGVPVPSFTYNFWF